MKKLLLVTGELSGFNYARMLIPYLRKDFKIYGVLMDDVGGAEKIFDSRKITSFGLFEAIFKIPALFGAKKRIAEFIEREKPHCVLLVDFPGFNLKVAEIAKKKNVKVFYFVPPKVWAWGRWRIKLIKALTDKVFVIFPFEEELYRRHGVNAVYIGNPLKDAVKPSMTREEFFEKYSLSPPLYVLMPGSREEEVKRLLEPMLVACRNLKGTFAIPSASSVDRRFIEKKVKKILPGAKILDEEEKYNLMFYADAGIIASGTASLESAIANLPHVVVYRLNPLTYLIAKRVVKLKWVSLPNILAGKEIVPELIQDVSPSRIAGTFLDLLERREKVKKLLKEEVSEKLRGGAIERLAESIREELRNVP